MCELCFAVKNCRESNSLLFNTLLYESKNFVIIPSIGPLFEDQIMIVSKYHFTALLSMDVDCIEELEILIDFLTFKYPEGMLFYEHGSFNQQKGGSCIEHTHIHVIPKIQHLFKILDGILPFNDELISLEDLENIIPIDFPYVLNITSDKKIRLYEAYNSHSQMMRKAICNALGRSDWDWSKNSQLEIVKKSINQWKRRININ
jgi:ATP adenylyltransferase